jgi:hypothetical protein
MTALTDRPRTARTVYGGGEDESSRPRTSHVVTPHSQSIVHLPQSRRRGERARESGKQGKQRKERGDHRARRRVGRTSVKVSKGVRRQRGLRRGQLRVR